jgi:hypothetical protein
MLSAGLGLTKLYNKLHDANSSEEYVQNLRDLSQAIDLEIAAAYGWSDINLDHGFHLVDYLPAGNQARFTISNKSRIEILKRLTEINQLRYKLEKSDSASTAIRSKTKSKKPKINNNIQNIAQPSLDFGG